MSTKQQPVTTTTATSGSSAPWTEAVPYLEDSLNKAGYYLNNQTGYNPYTGQTQANLSSQTNQAMQGIQNVAQGAGQQLGNDANTYAQGVINNGGISQGQEGALGVLNGAANGGMQIGTGNYSNVSNAAGGDLSQMQGLYGGLLNNSNNMYGSYLGNASQPSAASRNLADMASGKDLASPNPYLMSALDAANRKTADTVNSQFSAAGRYGSGAQTNVLSRNIGEQNTNALMNDYEQARQRQLAATGQIDAANQGLLGAQLSGISGLTGAQLSGISGIGNAQQAARGLQMNAAQGIAGIQGQNVQNQLGAANSVNDAYGQGMNRALNTALNGGQISNQLYAPYQQLAGVGSFMDDRSQQALQSKIDLYNQQQAYPWEQLARANAIFTGAGQLGGTQNGTNTQTKPGQSTLQQYLGYGSTGLGLLGKLF